MTKSILRKKVYFGLLFWKDSVQNGGEDIVKSRSRRKLVDHIPTPHRKQRELQQEVRWGWRASKPTPVTHFLQQGYTS